MFYSLNLFVGKMNKAAASFVILAIATFVGSVDSNVLERAAGVAEGSAGSAGIQVEHYEQQPREGKYCQIKHMQIVFLPVP